MDYHITPQGKIIFRIALHGKALEICNDFNSEYNAVVKDGKFRRKSLYSNSEMGCFTGLNFFLEELKHFIDYLNNCETIDEVQLGYALYDRCLFHSLKNGRLIDGDLASYADTLLLIYETYKNGNLDNVSGVNIRSAIIRQILVDLADFIYISNFVAPGQPFALVKYVKGTQDLGSVLRI